MNGTKDYKNWKLKEFFQRKWWKGKEWTNKEKFQNLQLFVNLLEGGFTIEESLSFMEKLTPSAEKFSLILNQEFAKGGNLAGSFQRLGYSKSVVSQMEFGEIHGKIQEVLKQILNHQSAIKTQREKLLKVSSYPILLLIFLFGICLILKNYLIPQMQGSMDMQDNWSLKLIESLPTIFLVFVLSLILLICIAKIFLRKFPPLQQVQFFSKIPFVKHIVIKWKTIEISREWGRLFQTGLEMKEVIEICKKTSHSQFFSELAEEMEKGLVRGESFAMQVEHFPFLEKTMKVMILSGDVKDTLGSELLFYSDLLWEEFLAKIERQMLFIQPIIFLFVAMMVVGLYAAFLLPMYESMGQIF